MYNMLWQAGIPLLRLHHRLKVGYTERVLQDTTYNQADIWMHSASGGEARIVSACLKALPEESKFSFVLTTWTKQGHDLLRELVQWIHMQRPLWRCNVHYAPFDIEALVSKYLHFIAPKCVFLIETELWPSLLRAVAKQHIPFYIVNARINMSTYRLYKKCSSLLKGISPTGIYPTSKADAERFSILFPKTTIQQMHNLKFASLFPPPSPTKAKGVVLYASLRRGEFSFFIESIRRVYQSTTNIVVWIVPRHVHHARVFARMLASKKLPYHYHRVPSTAHDALKRVLHKSNSMYFSDTTGLLCENPYTCGIHMWETFGVLPTMLQQSSVVIMGGTTQERYGGQNFLEPLSYGIVPIIGEHIQNFLWAAEGLEEAGLLQKAPSSNAVASSIIRAIMPAGQGNNNIKSNDDAHFFMQSPAIVQRAFYTHIEQKCDGVDTVVELLERYKKY